jgi:hypothetical protein
MPRYKDAAPFPVCASGAECAEFVDSQVMQVEWIEAAMMLK